ncbi:MAG: hypothetical protein ACC647_07340 [Anaerolineales bacterium]
MVGDSRVKPLRRMRLPLVVGVLGSLGLALLYFAIVSLAESPEHALDLAWQDRFIIGPIILGFGVQLGLYAILKTGAYVPTGAPPKSGALTGASGGISATAMVACCAHHVTDVLPLVGLTAASAFLAEYRIPFMLVGFATTVIGILVMGYAILKARRQALGHMDARWVTGSAP